MKRIYGYAVLIAGLVVAPVSNVLAQNLQQIGTAVIEVELQPQPVPVFSAGVQYEAPTPGEKVEFSPFTLTKKVDATSPKLFKANVQGQRIAKATIDLFDPTGGTTRYELEDVMVIGMIVKSVQDGKKYALVEEVSFDYSRIKQTVFTPSGPVQFCWDKKNYMPC